MVALTVLHFIKESVIFSYGCAHVGQMDFIRIILVRFGFENYMGSISMITYYRCID